MVALLTRSSSRPVPAESREERSPSMQPATEENFFGNVPGLKIVKGSPTSPGCTVVKPIKYNITVGTSLQEFTQYVTVCCDGWSGTECSVTTPTPSPTPSVASFTFDPISPCANLSCAGVDNAICAVVAKCGRQFPVFLDPKGQLAECTNSQMSVEEITCTVPCQVDPCAGNVSCPLYPEAMCFISECDCTALWLLPTGVEVNCFPVDKRDTSSGSGCAQQP